MPRLTNLALGAFAFLLLAAVLTPDARAERGNRTRPGAIGGSSAFSVSGTLTGVMNGQVIIDGVAFQLSPKARAYQIGTGGVSLDRLPIGQRVYARGNGKANARTIYSVVARPLSEGENPTADMSRFVSEESPSAPK